MPFSIEIEGFEDLFEKLNKFEDKSKLGLQEGMVKILRNDISRRFLSSPSTTSGGDVYGNVYWRALKDSYLRQRPDRVLGQVLIDTGNLRDSLTVENAPGSYVNYGPDFVELGTRVSYAEELNRTWQLLFVHDELINKLTKWTIEYYLEDKEFPDEF